LEAETRGCHLALVQFPFWATCTSFLNLAWERSKESWHAAFTFEDDSNKTVGRLKEWGDTYGGVFSLKFGNSTVIVLFDRKAVHHLLDKKGVIYSERPQSYVPSLVTGGDSFAFMNSTPLWRAERKVAVHNLSVSMMGSEISDRNISLTASSSRKCWRKRSATFKMQST
jgi:hypothetical protein